MTIRILILLMGIWILNSCVKESIPEEKIVFTTSPDNSNGKIFVSSDTLNLTITISSLIPEVGVKFILEMTQADNGLSIFQKEGSLNKTVNLIKIFPVSTNATVILRESLCLPNKKSERKCSSPLSS